MKSGARTFSRRLVVAAGLALLPIAYVSASFWGRRSRSAILDLGTFPKQLVADIDEAIDLESDYFGAQYLRARERDVDVVAFFRNLAGQYPGEKMFPRIAAMIADEYRDGEMVLVDGWMFSVTEARLRALREYVASHIHESGAANS